MLMETADKLAPVESVHIKHRTALDELWHSWGNWG